MLIVPSGNDSQFAIEAMARLKWWISHGYVGLPDGNKQSLQVVN